MKLIDNIVKFASEQDPQETFELCFGYYFVHFTIYGPGDIGLHEVFFQKTEERLSNEQLSELAKEINKEMAYCMSINFYKHFNN